MHERRDMVSFAKSAGIHNKHPTLHRASPRTAVRGLLDVERRVLTRREVAQGLTVPVKGQPL